MSDPTKTCRKCGKSLPLDCFWKAASNADGLMTSCRTCARQPGSHPKPERQLLRDHKRRRFPGEFGRRQEHHGPHFSVSE
jgi:hypothetical protein